MKITANRQTVLEALNLANGPLTADDLSAAAPSHVALKREWAYPSLRWAERHGLVETVGAERGMTLYQITQAGRLQLGAI